MQNLSFVLTVTKILAMKWLTLFWKLYLHTVLIILISPFVEEIVAQCSAFSHT